MIDIKTFIADARSKGLKDDQIRDALKANGWDDTKINLELLGLEVPVAMAAPTTKSPTNPQSKQPSLSHLMAALLHVLLWFFTGSSTVTIIGVVTAFTGFDVSTEVLAAMIAVTVVTFTPYAILFVLFLRKTHHEPLLVPSKVWSIITICLHSVGAMIAAITLIVALIVAGQVSVILSSLLVMILNLLIVATYCFAAFSPVKITGIRSKVLIAHLIILIVLFGSLFVMSILRLGPAKHDEQLRKNMSTSVSNIRDYTQKNMTLPKDGGGVIEGEGITYTVLGTDNYRLCGDFQASKQSDPYGYDSSSYADPEDTYISEYNFYNKASGKQCFDFKSGFLTNDYNDYDYQ